MTDAIKKLRWGLWVGWLGLALMGAMGCDPSTGEDSADCSAEEKDECNICGGDNSSCMDCAGVPNGEATLDECDTCDDDPSNDCEQDCNEEWGGTATIDPCGECVGGSTGETACEQDCNEEWGGTATIDPCGECVGGSTGETACEQDCNGEWGGTHWLSDCGCVPQGNSGDECDDCNGVPNGNAALDNCNVCDSNPNNDCVLDCNSEWGGDAIEDMCGTCDNDSTNDCEKDCTGEWGGTHWLSDCGCVPQDNSGDECDDCNGVPNGNAALDNCNVCDSNVANDCAEDCNGEWGGDAALDDCNVCDNDVSNDNTTCVQDCNGVWGGDGVLDDCNVCDADNSNDNSTCAQDCNGVWGGPALEDNCGTCDEDPENDCVQDCNGQWGGMAQADNCGTCDNDPDNDCVQDCLNVWGGTHWMSDCGCVPENNPGDGCDDCAGTPNGPAETDNCGTCDSDPTNDCVQDCNGQWGGDAVLDDCNVCDNDPGNNNSTCDQDCAGVWGGNAILDDCNICDADSSNNNSTCDQDCAGDWGGDAVLDNCGVCDSDPTNDCVQDCAGVWGGTRWESDCGCVAANATGDECDDCQGTPNGTYWESECGCVPQDDSGDACDDCSGTPNGIAVIDNCEVCTGGTTGQEACVQDCAGVWGGLNWESDCGCVAAENTGDDCDDCAGTPNGDALLDNCGTCDADVTNDCVQDCAGQWGGGHWESDCGCVAADATGDECDDCQGTPNGTYWASECGCVAADNSGDDCDDCAGTPNGLAVLDVCNTCDDDTTNDCTFEITPAANAVSVPWEPEMGIRIRIPSESVNLAGTAVLSDLASVLTLTDQANGPVAGETKLFIDEEERILFFSFVPESPLFGDHTYDLALDSSASLMLSDSGGTPFNLEEAMGGETSWTFTTAEMTRFVLQVLMEFDDTVCHCPASPEQTASPACDSVDPHPGVAYTVPGLCLSEADGDAIVFGSEPNQVRGYWSDMSGGRLVVSKLRGIDGQLIGTKIVRREGVNTFFTLDGDDEPDDHSGYLPFRNEQEAASFEEMKTIIDFDRYTGLQKPGGGIHAVYSYVPESWRASIENNIAFKIENGHSLPDHFNVYVMYISGRSDTSTFGSSGSPSGGNFSISASMTHNHKPYEGYVWLHETGHGFFGMTDLYYPFTFPAVGGSFGIMGGNYGTSPLPQPPNADHTLSAELVEPTEPYDDVDIDNILADASADAHCGSAESPCELVPRYLDGKIWKFPAVIENGEVVGHYLVEMYGTNSHDANLEFQGVPHLEHPGVVSIWKTDNSLQKIYDHHCSSSDCSSYISNDLLSRWGFAEYYPSCPNIMSDWGEITPIYKTFPWWNHENLPYVTQDNSDVPGDSIPTQIELPVVEVPTYGTLDCEDTDNPVMDATCRFGGGYKVGLITLDFSDTLDTVQTQINAAPLERSSYLLPDALPFTLSFESQPDTPMTYADHIYAQHEQYITDTSDDYCHQILTDGFMAPD